MRITAAELRKLGYDLDGKKISKTKPPKTLVKATKPLGKLLISFPVDPMGKPRMTVGDKANYRPVTKRYWQYKSMLKNTALGADFEMPESDYHMVFYIPVPKSWNKEKKQEMIGTSHQQKPDKDNLEKAVLDCLCEEDSHIWDGRVTKYWSSEGRIDIYSI